MSTSTIRDSVRDVECQLLYEFKHGIIVMDYFKNDVCFKKFKEKFNFASAAYNRERNVVEYEMGATEIENRKQIVSILRIEEDSLFIMGKTTTQVLEKILNQVINFLSDEIKPIDLENTLSRKRYGTTCKAAFSFEFATLLNPTFKDFVNNDVAGKFKREGKQIVVHPHEVRIKINVVPDFTVAPENLSTERRSFAIEVERYSDYKDHFYSVFSELDFNEHLQVMEGLNELMRLS